MLQSKYELADERNLSVKARSVSETADSMHKNQHHITYVTSADQTSTTFANASFINPTYAASVNSSFVNLSFANAASVNHCRTGYGETWAKVILFGEHSVVYGYSAVALPLKNLRMRATVHSCDYKSVLNPASIQNPASSQSFDSQITLSCLGFTGKLSKIPPRLSSIRTAIHAALEFVGWSGEPLQVATESDFPPERGLGSSAAAAGAVIRAILDYYDVRASADELFALTQSAERVAHGHPSGLDATATSASWPVRFQSGEFARMDITMRAWLVLADSGCKGMTRVTVEAIHSRLETNPVAVDAQLEELGALAVAAEDDLALGRAEDMGTRMIRAHQILADLGVSTSQLDALVRTACAHGALGAKLTGGGGGGCVIALADSEDSAHCVSAALRNAGACNTWIVNIGDSVIN
ncbi:mevalonate kinase [Gardnerella vaginalis]|uniref:mevalonate kinase n=1 Tax=Gardnerella vaginalis TaxID=2702 RepID=UPI000B14F482|nr:mevalonate kinase [Gardnerella vaginalis]